jgi:hypothetical protein
MSAAPSHNPIFAAMVKDEVRARERRAYEIPDGTTLEQLVGAPDLGALPLSPAQRALCRAADGLPVANLNGPSLNFHFGIDASRLPKVANDQREYIVPERPRVVVVSAGVRSAKSIIGAIAALLHSSLNAVFRRKPEHPDEIGGPDGLVGVRPGELVRALIVAPFKHLSRAPMHHLIGAMNASARLRLLIHREGAEFIEIKRRDGAIVRVELVAAAPGGANLRSTWLAGILFDEADFHDDEDAAVNLREQVDAVIPRMLPGAQIWVVSSPWEDSGPFHEMFQSGDGSGSSGWGKPGRYLSFHSDSLSMNPTLDRADIEAARKRDPTMAAREYDGVPLPTGATGFFPEEAITACFFRPEPYNLPANDATHWGGADLGFRKNSSALTLCRQETRDVGGRRVAKVVVAFMEERIPQKGAPLKPSEVCHDFAETALNYRAGSVEGDIHYADTAKEEFAKTRAKDGRTISYEEFHASAENQTDRCTELRRRMLERLVEGPADPRLIKQLKDTKMRKMPSGIHVVLPKHGAAHADVLMSLVLSATQVPLDVSEERHKPAFGGRRRWA